MLLSIVSWRVGDANKPKLENDAQNSTLARRDTDSRVLTAAEFRGLSDVPPEVEWFANITNPNTRRAYQNDVRDFMLFAGIREPQEFRIVVRSHLIASRKLLETRSLAAATIRRAGGSRRSPVCSITSASPTPSRTIPPKV